jgi:localization factor PodJL
MQTQVGLSDRFDGRRRSAEGAAAAPARRVPAPPVRRPPGPTAEERLDLLSRQLVALGEAMGRRIAVAEQNSHAEAEQVRQELRRARSDLQARIERAEAAQQELQRELGRVAERLIERLDERERRSLEGLDSLRERLASVADVAEARHAEASRRLLEEMALSEARTADRICQAIADLEARLEPAPAPAAPAAPAAFVQPALPAHPARPRRTAGPLIAATGFGLALGAVTAAAVLVRQAVPPAPAAKAPPASRAGPQAPRAPELLRPATADAASPEAAARRPPVDARPAPPARPGPQKAEAATPETIRLLARAADGDVQAEKAVAALYASGGGGLARDPAAVRSWTGKAALAGDPEAMYGLGLDYLRGRNGAADPAVAARWFRMAAERGVAEAALDLGQLYESGRGTMRDWRQARRWYNLALKGGAAQAAARLAALGPEPPPEPPTPPVPPDASAPIATNRAAMASAEVLEVQQTLSRLGYYLGPIDGLDSPALEQALKAYRLGRPAGR